MAALNFPTSPTLNQIYTANGKSWRWDGTAWKSNNIIGTINTGSQYQVAYYAASGTTISGSSNLQITGSGVTIAFSTASSSIYSGAFTVVGGASIGQTLNIGGNLNLWAGSYYTGFKSNQNATGSTTYTFPASTPATGTSVLSSDISGILSWVPMTATSPGGSGTVYNGSLNAIPYYPSAGTAITGSVDFTNTGTSINIGYGTSATNSSSGALTVVGGVGIGGSLYTSSSYSSSISNVVFNNGIVTNGSWAGSTITAFYGGTGLQAPFVVGDLLYANTSSTWSRLASNSNSGYILASAGTGATPVYTNPATITVGNATTAANINIVSVTTQNTEHPLIVTPTTGTASGVAISSNTTLTYNPSLDLLSASGILITSGLASTTTTTGALVVKGGIGASGQINAASLQLTGNAIINGNLQFKGVGTFGDATSDTITSLARYASDLLPSIDNSYDLGNNALGWRFFKVSGIGSIGTVYVTGSTASTSSTSGALIVAGGAGIAKTSYFGQDVIIQGTTAATSTTTGALTISGGVGIAGTILAGGTISSIGASIFGILYTNNIQIGQGGNNLNFLDQAGNTLGNFNTSNGWFRSAQTTQSTSTTTGALVSAGGLGVAGNAFIGNTTTITSTTISTTSSSGALVVYGGAGIAKTSYFGQDVKIQGSSASTSTTTGALTVAGGVGIGSSLIIGGSVGVGTNLLTSTVNITGSANILGSTVITAPDVTNKALRVLGFSSSTQGDIFSLEHPAGGSFTMNGNFAGQAGGRFTIIASGNSQVRGSTFVIQASDSKVVMGVDATSGAGNVYLSNGTNIQLYNSTNAQYAGFKYTGAATTTYTLPASAPGAGVSVLQSDVAGTMSWVPAATGGGSPGGSNSWIQYNNAGSFGATSEFTWTPGIGVSLFQSLDIRSAKSLRFFNVGNSAYSAIQAGSVAANYTLTLPTTLPATGTSVMVSDSSGNMAFAPVTGVGISVLTGATGITISHIEPFMVYFSAGYTPTSTGADSFVFTAPWSTTDGTTSITYNIRRVQMRVETSSSGTSSIKIEKYAFSGGTGISAFSTSSTGSTANILAQQLNIAGAAIAETFVTSASIGFSTGFATAVSGDKFRVNFTALNATHANFSIFMLMDSIS